MQFPSEEKYGLISQIRRCVVSIPTNISEGCGRNTDKDFAHFLNISLGSAYELETLFILSSGSLTLISGEQLEPIQFKISEIQKNDFRLNQDVAPRVLCLTSCYLCRSNIIIMSTATETKQAIKGGEFLIRETLAQDIFIPEEFNEEQKMIMQQCKDFLAKEVTPRLNEIDSMKDPKLMPSILDKAGELGLLGTSVPQELGGFGMDFNTTMLVAEVIGGGHSVAVALSAHTGIGTLPILYYGNDAQKKKYIPKLATGEWESRLLFDRTKFRL